MKWPDWPRIASRSHGRRERTSHHGDSFTPLAEEEERIGEEVAYQPTAPATNLEGAPALLTGGRLSTAAREATSPAGGQDCFENRMDGDEEISHRPILEQNPDVGPPCGERRVAQSFAYIQL